MQGTGVYLCKYLCVRKRGKQNTINHFFKSLSRPSRDSGEQKSDESNIFMLSVGERVWRMSSDGRQETREIRESVLCAFQHKCWREKERNESETCRSHSGCVGVDVCGM